MTEIADFKIDMLAGAKAPASGGVARFEKTNFAADLAHLNRKQVQQTVTFESMDNPTPADLAKVASGPASEFFEVKNGKIVLRFVPIRDRIKPPKGRVDYGWNEEKKIAHLRSAYGRGWQQFPYLPRKHDGVLHIVGGGPSLKRCLPELRRAARTKKNFVLSLNKTHDFLWNLPKLGLGQAIPSWGAALLDPCDWVKDYITPRPGVQYFLGDQCAPATFDVFEKPGLSKWVYRSTKPGKDEGIPPHHMVFIVGGSTVGLRARFLGYLMGFREIHYWGFDSSAEITDERPDGKMHGYDKDESVKDRLLVKIVDESGFEQEFTTNSHMARQAQEYKEMREEWISLTRKGKVHWIKDVFHGDGLLPTMAAHMGLHADPARNSPLNDEILIPGSDGIPGSHAIPQESQNQGETHAA